MPLSCTDVIGPAFQRVKQQLFVPFRLGQWVRLAFVGFLAGEIAGGGFPVGIPGGFPSFPQNFPQQHGNQFQAAGFDFRAGALVILLICFIGLLAFALAILFIYVSSRMRFVLFDSVVAGECRIREFWRQRGDVGFRYFIWQLLFGLGIGIGFIVVIGVPLAAAWGMGWLSSPGDHIAPLVLSGILLFGVIFAVSIVLLLVQVLIKDFVVPQMACDGVSVGAGWRRLWAMMRQEKGGYAGYLGMKLALNIAASIVLGIIGLIVFLVLLIPVGGAGLIGVLGGQAVGLTWNPLTIAIAVAGGLVAFAGIFFVMALISAPATVFFPAYSIYFFADRYPALHSALYPPAPDPDTLNPSPQN